MQTISKTVHVNFPVLLRILFLGVILGGCAKDFHFPDTGRRGFIIGEYPEEEWIVKDYDSTDFSGQPDYKKKIDVTGDSVPDLEFSIYNENAGSKTPYRTRVNIRNLSDSIELNTTCLKQKTYNCICGDLTIGMNLVISYYSNPDYLVCPDSCELRSNQYVQEFCRIFDDADTVFFDSQWSDFVRIPLGSAQSGQAVYFNGIFNYNVMLGNDIWNGVRTIAFRMSNGDQYRWGTIKFKLKTGDTPGFFIYQATLSRNYLTLSRSIP